MSGARAHPAIGPVTSVGVRQPLVDGIEKVTGRAAYTADLPFRHAWVGLIGRSPVAHGVIRRIETTRARALPGVRAVIHCNNVARVKYASGGQSYPNPPPHDQVSFDNKVRYIGDRVAAVAADTLAIAEEAVRRIHVTYEVLPAVFDVEEAIRHLPERGR